MKIRKKIGVLAHIPFNIYVNELFYFMIIYLSLNIQLIFFLRKKMVDSEKEIIELITKKM